MLSAIFLEVFCCSPPTSMGEGSPALSVQLRTNSLGRTQRCASRGCHTPGGRSRAHFHSLTETWFNPSDTKHFPEPLKGLLILNLPSNLEILLKNEGSFVCQVPPRLMRLLRHIRVHRRTFTPGFGTVELRAFVSLNPTPFTILLCPSPSSPQSALSSSPLVSRDSHHLASTSA